MKVMKKSRSCLIFGKITFLSKLIIYIQMTGLRYVHLAFSSFSGFYHALQHGTVFFN